MQKFAKFRFNIQKLTVCDACCLNDLMSSDEASPSGIVLPRFLRSAVNNVALSCS